MAEGVQEVTYPCPGEHLHTGEEKKCEFCKSDTGNAQVVEGMPQIDRFTGERLVAACCKPCENNLRRSSAKQYKGTSIS